jgi:hypothetical protein
MNSLFNIQTNKIKTLYNSISFLHKTKEKITMTLEPLQAMVQIALLSVLPIGTKMAIYENILYLQSPSVIQPISRWYYADKKDDLFFLFQVIKRFIKWYGRENANSPIDTELYKLIVGMAKLGLDNLIRTYQTIESSMALIQIIKLYQDILTQNIIPGEIEQCDKSQEHQLDEVFENIIKIYNSNLITIIYNSLLLIQHETDETNINNYIDGLGLIMNKTNNTIKIWIKSNLVA